MPEKVWTEEAIIAYFDVPAKNERVPIQLFNPRDHKELKLRYADLPASLQAQADEITEDMIFHFVSTAATHTTNPNSIEKRVAHMRRSTFSNIFHAFKETLNYCVYVITCYTAADLTTGTKQIRVNLTLDDCYNAISKVYHKPSQKDNNTAAGIITDFGNDRYLITDCEYRYAFSPHQESGARIVGNLSLEQDDPSIDKLIDEAAGKATVDGVRFFEMNKGRFSSFTGNTEFLKMVLSILVDQKNEHPDIVKNGCIFRVSRKAICNYLGIRTANRSRIKSGDHSAAESDQAKATLQRIDLVAEAGQYVDRVDIAKHFNVYRDVIGMLPDGSYYVVLTFRGYDATTDSYELSSPYVAHIVEEMENKRQKLDKEHPHSKYANPNYGYCKLVHGTIYGCKNEPAKEILDYLCRSFIERGETNQTGEKGSRRVAFDVKCSTILRACPILRERIDKQICKGDKNVMLRRAFTGVINTNTAGKELGNLFREYTSVYTYFDDMRITWAIPTIDTLDKTTIRAEWKPKKEAADPVPVVIIKGKSKPKHKSKKTTQ